MAKFLHLDGLRRFSLTSKLATINAVLMLSLVAVLAVALRLLPSELGTTSDLAQLARAQRASQNADMLHDALHAHVLNALLIGEVPDISASTVAAAVGADATEFRKELFGLAGMTLKDARLGQALQGQQAMSQYVAKAEATVQLAASNRALALRQMPQFNAAFEAAKQALATQTALLAEAMERAHEAEAAANAHARQWLTWAAAIAVVIGWVCITSIGQSIRRSLTSLRDVAHDVADGQLERRSTVSGNDEVGQLASSVNRMAENLNGMIHRMRLDAERGVYGAELTQAMDMADSESEAYEVAARAMSLVSAHHAMELLIADASDAHLERAAQHPTAGAPGCSVKASFGCIAVRRGHAVTFPNSTAMNACPRLRERGGPAHSAACVPVTFMGRALGVLHASGTAEQPLSEAQFERLATLGVQAGGRIGTVRAFERTQLQASTDALTGLPNRRTLEHRIRRLCMDSRRFSLVMCDLDNFKRLNDTHGHQAGDDALRSFSEVVRSCTREHDVAGRWGGEEFVFILVDADAEQALQWAGRVRESLARTLKERGKPAFTASFGIVESGSAPTAESLARLSDIALYRAKSEGRDRAVVAESGHAGDEAAERRKGEPGAAVNLEMLVNHA